MKEREIFDKALAIVAPAERSQYLDEVCGDNERLRGHIEGLLLAHEDLGSFLQSPPVGPTIDQPITEKPGTQIGPYKLLQQIGEGGMGVVYMAEQKEPVKRRVALKIIKPGMDTRQVIARFEAERQALAMMDHPNIAKVLDAGQTDSGRPYFVMELVKGVPVTQYCDEQHLNPKERLELFVPICQAVQHAHQKGIIHRDIKPSNILIALFDGQPVPKVIDFGVAKATSQTLTEETMFTQLGQVVGTLEYMSPEQAQVSQLDVDTRSDIYSLGVLLYELLTGETPFDRTRLRSAAFDEVLRIIREEDPSKPSTKVSSSETLASIAANRRIDAHKLGTTIRGELDWIVMKALEKDRARRYETASKFAEDVQHYLNDESVVACPPSVSYRFGKFARRNRVAMLVTSLVAASLIVGISTATWQAIRATKAANGETKAREEADAYYARALQVVKRMLTEVGEKDLADVPYFQPVRQRVLRLALEFNERLLTERSTDPRARFETGMAHVRVADIQQLLGNHSVVEESYLNGIRILEELTRSPENSLASEQALALAHHKYGSFLAFSGRLQEAEDEAEQAISLWESLGRQHSENTRLQQGLAQSLVQRAHVLTKTNRAKEAELVARRAINAYDEASSEVTERSDFLMEFADAHQCLGMVLDELGSSEESAEAYRAAAAILKKKRGRSFHPLLARRLAQAIHNVGEQLKATGKPKEAAEQFREAIQVAEQLVEHFPSVPAYQRSLAGSYNSLGHALLKCEEPAAAEQALERALEVHERLASEYADAPDCQSELAAQLQNLAAVLSMRGKAEEARQRLERAIRHQKSALKLNPEHPRYQKFLRNHYWNLGNTLTRLGASNEAVGATNEAIRWTTRLLEKAPGNVEYQKDLPKLHSKLGAILNNQALMSRKQSRLEEARELLERAVAEQERAVELDDQDPTYRRFLRNHYVQLTQTLLSLKAYREAAERATEWLKISPPDLVVDDCYNTARWFALSVAKTNDAALTELCATRAVETLREGIHRGFRDLLRLEKDSSFDALRDRDDFRAAVKELKHSIQIQTPKKGH